MENVTKEQFIARLAFLASSVCVYQNQNKPKSLVNIVRNLSCLLETLLGSKIAGQLNQVVVKYLINRSAVL